MISPHFPPDTRAAAHRMRLLAPCLQEHGWEPTVVSVDPRDLGVPIERDLERFVHGDVRVERVRAFGGARGRFLGIGDLGLRSLWPIERRARRLLGTERYDAILITVPPHYTATLGARLNRLSGTPFVLDYQDPWVSAWGLSVGGGPNGAVDWKSRLSRWLALVLEPRALRGVAGLTAVSEGTLEGLLDRHPALRELPRAEIPLGGDPRDFLKLRESPRANRFFDPADGRTHVAYVGTLPPAGGREVLAALLRGAALAVQRSPALRAKLRFHFIGMSMQRTGRPAMLALELAQVAGVADLIDEHPLRIDYLDALTVLGQAGLVLLLGGTERHYTASRVYPALLSGNPLLAVYNEASTACEALRRLGPPGATHLITFGTEEGPATVTDAVANALAALSSRPVPRRGTPSGPDLGRWSASSLARTMAQCLSAAAAQLRPGARADG